LKGKFKVSDTHAAREDLLRLFDHLLAQAQDGDDFAHAQSAIDTIRLQVEGLLSHSPFVFRKAGSNPFVREMLIPFGAMGCVALYEIEGAEVVSVLALRHQREDDCH